MHNALNIETVFQSPLLKISAHHGHVFLQAVNSFNSSRLIIVLLHRAKKMFLQPWLFGVLNFCQGIRLPALANQTQSSRTSASFRFVESPNIRATPRQGSRLRHQYEAPVLLQNSLTQLRSRFNRIYHNGFWRRFSPSIYITLCCSRRAPF